MTEFEGFRKIPRLFRDITITEKIDGTNAQVLIELVTYDEPEYGDKAYVDLGGDELYKLSAGSRNRYLTPDQDNFGFAAWVWENADELVKLGPGRHFGEWWGSGIQRGYGLQNGEKRFSLFNTKKWANNPDRPAVCGVVPVIYEGPFSDEEVRRSLQALRDLGSYASAGFPRPEGIIVYHHALNNYFKVTLENDEEPKSKVRAA